MNQPGLLIHRRGAAPRHCRQRPHRRHHTPRGEPPSGPGLPRAPCPPPLLPRRQGCTPPRRPPPGTFKIHHRRKGCIPPRQPPPGTVQFLHCRKGCNPSRPPSPVMDQQSAASWRSLRRFSTPPSGFTTPPTTPCITCGPRDRLARRHGYSLPRRPPPGTTTWQPPPGTIQFLHSRQGCTPPRLPPPGTVQQSVTSWRNSRTFSTPPSGSPTPPTESCSTGGPRGRLPRRHDCTPPRRPQPGTVQLHHRRQGCIPTRRPPPGMVHFLHRRQGCTTRGRRRRVQSSSPRHPGGVRGRSQPLPAASRHLPRRPAAPTDFVDASLANTMVPFRGGRRRVRSSFTTAGIPTRRPPPASLRGGRRRVRSSFFTAGKPVPHHGRRVRSSSPRHPG